MGRDEPGSQRSLGANAKEMLQKQAEVEAHAMQLIKEGKREQAIRFLTQYSNDCANNALQKAWDTGDLIWTTFDGKW